MCVVTARVFPLDTPPPVLTDVGLPEVGVAVVMTVLLVAVEEASVDAVEALLEIVVPELLTVLDPVVPEPVAPVEIVTDVVLLTQLAPAIPKETTAVLTQEVPLETII